SLRSQCLLLPASSTATFCEIAIFRTAPIPDLSPFPNLQLLSPEPDDRIRKHLIQPPTFWDWIEHRPFSIILPSAACGLVLPVPPKNATRTDSTPPHQYHVFSGRTSAFPCLTSTLISAITTVVAFQSNFPPVSAASRPDTRS